MKFFIKRILQFTFLIIVLASLLQCIISYRIKGKSIYAIDNLVQVSNINADLVFLGSSRCWAQFDPRFFDTTYKLKSINIGVDGHSEISMAITRLKDYLSRNKPPKYAIINFDPLMSAGDETNNTNLVHKNMFARYAFLPGNKDSLMVNYFKFNFSEKYVPLYAIFKYKLLTDCLFLPNTDNPYARYGYDMHDENWDTIADPVSDIEKQFFFKSSEMSAITNSLNNLNHLCRVNNIKLLCIQTPVYRVCQDDSAFSRTKIICGNLNIPFIDANKKYIRNNIKYFYNSNHLNKKGVEIMDSVLKTDTLLSSFLHNQIMDK